MLNSSFVYFLIYLKLWVTVSFQNFYSPDKLITTCLARNSDTSLNAGSAIVTIGTRGSPLALAQAHETKRLLGLHFPELAVEGAVEIQKIMTKAIFLLF